MKKIKKNPNAPKRSYVRRKTTIAGTDVPAMDRIANALEALVALYTRDLAERGIHIDIPSPSGEGEVLTTDDAETAALLERLILNRPIGSTDRGIYIGDAPGGGTPAPKAGQTEEVGSSGWLDQTLFGSNWSINRGPEGAEEDWAGPGSLGSTGPPASGAIPR